MTADSRSLWEGAQLASFRIEAGGYVVAGTEMQRSARSTYAVVMALVVFTVSFLFVSGARAENPEVAEFSVRAGGPLTTGPGGVGFTVDRDKIARTDMVGHVEEVRRPHFLHVAPRPGRLLQVTLPAGYGGWHIARGHSGDLWLSGTLLRGPTGWLTRITAHGALSRTRIPAPERETGDITAGPGRSMWFLESEAGAQDETALLGRLGPGGRFSEIALPPGTFAEELVAGPDGHLWVARLNEIDRVSSSGAITRYRGLQNPAALTTGLGRTIWFAENGPRIGRIEPGGGVKYFRVPGRGFLGGMTEGPDGNLWYTNWRHRGSPTIGRMTARGGIKEFPLSDLGKDRVSIPDEIVAGPDGNLWFTAHSPPAFGRVTSRGKIRLWRLPEFRGPSDIVVGPHDNLWFPEPRVNPMTIGVWAPRLDNDVAGSTSTIAEGALETRSR